MRCMLQEARICARTVPQSVQHSMPPHQPGVLRDTFGYATLADPTCQLHSTACISQFLRERIRVRVYFCLCSSHACVRSNGLMSVAGAANLLRNGTNVQLNSTLCCQRNYQG